MKNKFPTYCIVFILTFLIFIPSVHAENKIVKITDNGNLYGILNPQSYYYDGEKEGIYVVYSRLNQLGDNPDGDVDSFIRFYDFETDSVSEEYLVGRGHGDSHGAPTLCIDDRGYIHVFYGCHSDQLEYAVSTYPEDISSWRFRTQLLPDELGYTYPKAVFADDSLYVFFRSRGHGGISLNQGKYACIISDDYGRSWSEQIEFVDPSNGEYAISCYPTGVKYANGYFHVVWYVKCESGDTAAYYGPNSHETRHNAYYAKSEDCITWYNVDKSYASTHITMHEMDEFYQVYNTTTQTRVIGSHLPDYSWVRYKTTSAPKLDVSPLGEVYVGLNPTDDGPVICYWEEAEWKRIFLPEKTSYIPFYRTKKLSEMPVNALGHYNGSIYLTNYGYNHSDEGLNVMWRNIYTFNHETQTLELAHKYTGHTLVFNECVSSIDNDANDYDDNPIIQFILKILDRFPLLRTWFITHFVL